MTLWALKMKTQRPPTRGKERGSSDRDMTERFLINFFVVLAWPPLPLATWLFQLHSSSPKLSSNSSIRAFEHSSIYASKHHDPSMLRSSLSHTSPVYSMLLGAGFSTSRQHRTKRQTLGPCAAPLTLG
ncbi:hypothetical protein E4U24_000712 [Claviceps purpurea]|nr:hypothetical protein E4U24_000712 [Claviceps purpurea]KAG6293192.1 hypothetical protein E4U46_007843 [Claviceps purpurea]